MNYYRAEIIIKAKHIQEAEEILDSNLALVNIENSRIVTIGYPTPSSNPLPKTI